MRLSYHPPRFLFRRATVLRLVTPGETFLEVGAGNLKMSIALLSKFGRGTSVEPASGATAIHASLSADALSRLTLVTDELSSVDRRQTVDCVVSCEVMEHVEDDHGFLDELRSFLGPGGQLIISVPAKQRYWSVHDEMVGHLRRYEREPLVELIEAHGFEVEEVAAYGFPFINLLWLARVVHGRRQVAEKSSMSNHERTEASGIAQNDLNKWLGLVFNPLTFAIPNLIARSFDRFDWSEGYVVSAHRIA
jgi:2-polyprenyl-3-methyl-5-hydroxy-6-metoxy-1,4-benzoquinol methylase